MQSNISFDEYQRFVDNMKIYPTEHKITYPALGLSGESGEYAEKIKKWLRGDKALDKMECLKELGDALFYIAASASDLGFTIQQVADLNHEKLSARKEKGTLQGSGDNR